MAYDDSLARAYKRIAELEAALRPFAEFHPSLLEWRDAYGLISSAHPEHKGVIRRIYPINNKMSRVCELWVGDFRRAAAAIGAKE